jgi:undecaprenyl-diphosphatase
MIDQLMIFFAQNGIYLIIIISLINAAMSFKNEAKSLIAIALSLAISYSISSLFYVPRPFVSGNFQPMIPHAPNSSFPSHHASAGFAMSFSTFNTNTMLGLVSSAIAVLMAIGRIYVGLHSKADIYGGLLIGGLCAIFAYSKFVDKILKNVFFKKKPIKKRKASVT